MAQGTSVLRGCLTSEDAVHFLNCLKNLGFPVKEEKGEAEEEEEPEDKKSGKKDKKADAKGKKANRDTLMDGFVDLNSMYKKAPERKTRTREEELRLRDERRRAAEMKAIKEDIEWLGFKWNECLYASSYFDFIYECAIKLIQDGKIFRGDVYTCSGFNQYGFVLSVSSGCSVKGLI